MQAIGSISDRLEQKSNLEGRSDIRVGNNWFDASRGGHKLQSNLNYYRLATRQITKDSHGLRPVFPIIGVLFAPRRYSVRSSGCCAPHRYCALCSQWLLVCVLLVFVVPYSLNGYCALCSPSLLCSMFPIVIVLFR